MPRSPRDSLNQVSRMAWELEFDRIHQLPFCWKQLIPRKPHIYDVGHASAFQPCEDV